MNKRNALFFLAPGLVLLTLFLVLPLVSILWPTVYVGGITFEGYINFFKDEFNLKILARTLRISATASVICILLGVPTSYFISRTRQSMRSFLMALSMFPMLTNSVVRSFAWINILGKNGVLNNLLVASGIVAAPITMLYTEFSILVGTVYLFLPIMVITLVGVMENIEPEVVEAAETLGAGRGKVFLKVILPLSMPGILVGSVLVFTGAMTAYTTPQLLGGNKNMMLATFIYQKAMTLGDWNGAGIVAAIMIVATLIVMKILNSIAERLDRRSA